MNTEFTIKMPNVTLSVSVEMKERMDSFSEVSWSDVCRSSIQSYLEEREKDVAVTVSEGLKFIAAIDPLTKKKNDEIIFLLKIKNNESFDIILDRAIAGVQFKIPEKKVDETYFPLHYFKMDNIKTNDTHTIGLPDELGDTFRKSLFEWHDKKIEIKWIVFGEIYYRSKAELYKSNFYIEGILDDSIREFIHDQMRI